MSTEETPTSASHVPRSIPKVWEHAYDFLADWVQHIPRARQHQVT